MIAQETYLRANRVWWSVALFIGPIAGALSGEATVAIVATSVLILAALVVFDTDRSWWPEAVRRLPQQTESTRVERWKLTLWSVVALLAGLVIGIFGPWGQV